jgi:hypothetical protein
MILKSLVVSAVGVVLLGGVAQAEAYRPGDFLKLDLKDAVLSPRPLGPPAQFEQVPVEAKSDAAASGQGRSDQAQSAPANAERRHVGAKASRAPSRPRHVAAVKKPARVRSNPLDANAADTRVQVWPCRSGGICNWKR